MKKILLMVCLVVGCFGVAHAERHMFPPEFFDDPASGGYPPQNMPYGGYPPQQHSNQFIRQGVVSVMEVNGLNAHEFISGMMPEKHCSVWVHLPFPVQAPQGVLHIMHIISRQELPYLKVFSEYKDMNMFQNSVHEIARYWEDSQISSISDDGTNLVAQIFPNVGRSGDPEVAFRAGFKQVLEQVYLQIPGVFFDQKCNNIPRWMLNEYPYRERIRVRVE